MVFSLLSCHTFGRYPVAMYLLTCVLLAVRLTSELPHAARAHARNCLVGIADQSGMLTTRCAFAGTPCVQVVAKLLDAIAAGIQQPLLCAPSRCGRSTLIMTGVMRKLINRLLPRVSMAHIRQ